MILCTVCLERELHACGMCKRCYGRLWRERKRGGHKPSTTHKPYVFLTVPMLTRAVQLRTAGLSYDSIRKVLEVDYGEAPSKQTIYRLVRPGSRQRAVV